MIDEKELIEEIKRLKVYITGIRAGKGLLNDYASEYRKSLVKVIEEQPKVGEWIPCSERLPEPMKPVLCWYEYDGGRKKAYEFGYVTGRSIYLHGIHKKNAKIIAWMELPEPYKERD